MTIKKLIIIFLLFLVLFLFLTNAELVSKSVLNALSFCYKTIIPSLFPFMVISSIILYTTRLFGNFKLINLILDSCKIYSNEILVGLISGFVIGARGICRKYNDFANKNDFCRAIILSSNAGIGFVIGCVGSIIWDNVLFGICLYLSQIISGIIIFKLSKNNSSFCNAFVPISDNTVPLFSAIVKAVKISVNSILSICGFNIFFSVISDIIVRLFGLEDKSLSFVLLNALTDFSKGAFCISQLDSVIVRVFFTGFCIGFGGICVHMQIFAECEEYPISKLRFTLSQALQVVLCGVFSIFFFVLLNIK